ncbi:MAG: hypothetical protein E2598_12465 [Sphingobium sp.]|nr:hypothetical protein [Sphingobium sp.]
MHRLRRQIQYSHGLASIMLACAFALHLLIPAGFMPVQTYQGIVITLCTGDGAKATALQFPLEHRKQGPETPAPAHILPCLFSALSVPFMTGGGAAILPLPLMVPGQTAPPHIAPILPDISAYWMPPSRGPPTAR